ncbi:MAG: hypothetical protein AAGF78_01800 [Pseudomonadota bacterium]
MIERKLIFSCVAATPFSIEDACAIAKALADEAAFSEPWSIYVTGAGDRRDTLSIRDTPDWLLALQDRWATAKRVRFWHWHKAQSYELSFDRTTGILTVEIPAHPDADLDVMRKAFLDRWDCYLINEDIWRYRRTGVVYRSGDWSVTHLADGLEAVLSRFGPIEHLDLIDGYISYEHRDDPNVERLRGAESVSGFLELLRRFDVKANKLRNIGASIRGPAQVVDKEVHGLALGLYVSHKPAPVTVEIRSSIPAAELARRLTPLSGKLGLGKPVPAVISGSDTSAGPAKFEDKPWAKYLLLPLLAGVIGLVSWQTFSYVRPDYTTEILTPAGTEQGIPVFAPGPVTVSWFLQPDPKILRPRILDAEAEVEIYLNGVRRASVSGQGHVTIALTTGLNTIVIRPLESDAEPETMQVRIEEREG